VTAHVSFLELRAVGKHFGGLQVIDDLSFGVPRGCRMALIGPNGAGKTTAFNLVSGVYPIDSGAILFDGRDISRVPSRMRIGLGIARSFQNIRLMPHLTALENVVLGQHCRRAGLSGLLDPVSLLPQNRWHAQARDALVEVGLAAYADEAVSNLPYGIQKRIELVRALMAEPTLLMLDEPAAGLNPAETSALRQRLMAISECGITLLIVEHDMHFVGALCDRVVVLNFGRKIAEGAPEEVRAHKDVREAYLGAEEAEPGSYHAS
jgi:branched-chain amino acid transport system ATP-binding protein